MRLRWVLVFALVVSAILFTTVLRDRTPVLGEYCTAKVGTTSAQIDLEQAQWSSLMAAVAIRDGLPPRAATIAIATAFQESKIHNIDYGDRDSLGLFQQRPSQGWGKPEQIIDPHYSIGKFYEGLVKVKDYGSMEITVAAQKVQRSAFPGAYAQHEDYARAMASSLSGYSPAAFTCQFNAEGNGNTTTINRSAQKAFGEVPVDVTDDSLEYPLNGTPANKKARGWALAHYLVANAANLRIGEISFGGRVWTAEDSSEGWVTETGTSSNIVRVTVS